MGEISKEEFIDIVKILWTERIPIKAIYRQLNKGVQFQLDRCFADISGLELNILKFSVSLPPDEQKATFCMALMDELQITYERDVSDKGSSGTRSEIVVNYPSIGAEALLHFRL